VDRVDTATKFTNCIAKYSVKSGEMYLSCTVEISVNNLFENKMVPKNLWLHL